MNTETNAWITPETAPEPAPTPKKDVPTAWKVIRCLLTIPFFLLLIVALIATVTLHGARNITSEATVQTVVEAFDFTQMDITSLVPIDTSDIPAGESVTVSDLLYESYDSLYQEGAVPIPLEKEAIDQFLSESTVDDFLTEKISGYMNGFLSGNGESARITSEEVVDLIRENEELIAEVSGGYELTEEDYQMIDGALKESGIDEALDFSSFVEENNSVSAVGQIVSPAMLWIAIGVCAALYLIVLLLNIRGNFLAMLYGGLALILSGGLCALTLALDALVSTALNSLAFIPEDLITPLVNQVLSGFWIPGLIMVGAGLLLIGGFIAIRVIQKHRTPAPQPAE